MAIFEAVQNNHVETAAIHRTQKNLTYAPTYTIYILQHNTKESKDAPESHEPFRHAFSVIPLCTISIWGFPKIGVPQFSSIFTRIYHEINHPFWGYPHLWKPPHKYMFIEFHQYILFS